MKLKIGLATVVLLFCFDSASGQNCPMDCSKESFPYFFCNGTDKPDQRCSTNPLADGAATVTLPGSICSFSFPSNAVEQPRSNIGLPPPDPAEPSVTNDEPSEPDYDANDPNPPNDYSTAHDLWDAIGNFYSGQGALIDFPSAPTPSDYDSKADYQLAKAMYDKLYTAYSSWKSAIENFDAWQAGSNNPSNYVQIWDDATANAEANAALASWYACCSGLSGQATGCCVPIIVETEPQAFFNNGISANDLPGTPAFTDLPISCPEIVCPGLNASGTARAIHFNLTPQFLYQSNSPDASSDPNYLAFSVPKQSFYTGTVPPRSTFSIAAGYNAVSFVTVLTHEFGHWLALPHPNDITAGGLCLTSDAPPEPVCCNNVTHCGKKSVLLGVDNNAPPVGVQDEDCCEFKKLYCTQRGVQTQKVESDHFSPEIYPNPTMGSSRLTYQTDTRSMVQIEVYDVLGKLMSEVFAGVQASGKHDVLLGTDRLPPGTYICQVRYGQRVAYINIIIKK